MNMRSPILNVMVNAALKVSKGLVRDFGEVEQLQVSLKGPADFVSSADLKAEEKQKYPDLVATLIGRDGVAMIVTASRSTN